MNKINLIRSLILLLLPLSMQGQPDKYYSLISLMNGQDTFINQSEVSISIPTWGYALEGDFSKLSVPGPTIYANQGDSVYVKLFNPSMEGHTIHLHGLDVDEANDGVPHFSGFVQKDQSFTYRFKAAHAGNFLYHCHVTTTMHLSLGMYGKVVIYPSDSSMRIFDNGPLYDYQYEYLFSEMDSRWNMDYTSIGSFLSYSPDLFLINGRNRDRAYKDLRHSIYADTGSQVLMRLFNVGYRVNRLVFPSNIKAVVYMSDGRVLDQPFETDTLIVYPGERYNVLAEVLDTIASYVSIDYLDPYRLKFLGRDYIPLNDSSFSYFAPTIDEVDIDTTGVGIKEKFLKNTIVLYPNPSQTSITIQSSTSELSSARVFNLSGQLQWEESLSGFQSELVLNRIDPGIYLMQIRFVGGLSSWKRFVKSD